MLINPEVQIELTFAPLLSHGFAFCQIGCDIPLQLQVLPQRTQLQAEIRGFKRTTTGRPHLGINTPIQSNQ